jgi:hypothetical protein
MKQEILEEAAEKYAQEENSCYTNDYYGFINGAKWQAEIMYSEEEVLKAQQAILNNIRHALDNDNYIIEYLEQFKKK